MLVKPSKLRFQCLIVGATIALTACANVESTKKNSAASNEAANSTAAGKIQIGRAHV